MVGQAALQVNANVHDQGPCRQADAAAQQRHNAGRSTASQPCPAPQRAHLARALGHAHHRVPLLAQHLLQVRKHAGLALQLEGHLGDEALPGQYKREGPAGLVGG